MLSCCTVLYKLCLRSDVRNVIFQEKEKKEKKVSLERHFNMPKEPEILVFPNRMAKGGKFDCKIVTLHNILDYRPEDSKEHSFEVSATL